MADCMWFAGLYFRVVFYLWLVYSSAGSCDQDAIGLESGYILDSEITASSVRGSLSPAKNGRLNYTAGIPWCAAPSDSSPYLQIDLETLHIICAVSTQGNSKDDRWVETYQLQSSNDGTRWNDYKEHGQVKTFLGNFDRSTAVKHVLYMGMVARFLRFLPKNSHNGVCLRAEVYGVQQSQGNLALYKPTSQSTTESIYVSSNAVDGNRATHLFKCTHTTGYGSTDPWWKVDLGQVEPVSELYIVNRGDCCGARLNGFEIRVGNVTTGGGASNHLCGSALSVPQEQGKFFQCKPTARGRYVYIRLPGSRKMLSLCEVEVYSTIRSNRALNQPASQSSTYPGAGGTADKAVDGKAFTAWGQGSCTVTNTESDPWWRVDLGSSLPVAEVFIVNRACGGICGDRFKGFEIRVGSDTTNGGSSNPQCGVGLLNLMSGEKKSFFCDPRLVGRYVYIRIPGNRKTMTICELEVYTTRRNYKACAGQAVGISDDSIIPDHRFFGSSSRSGNEPPKGRLRGSSAWVPSTNNDANDFLQIDLGSVYFVCAVATQGNPSANEWTMTYNITTSLNNANWVVYGENNKPKAFVGNSDRNTIRKHSLKQPLAAKFIRFHPVTFNSRKALRVEVFGSLESCQSSLGMENETIPSSQITASSVTDSSHGTSFSGLYTTSSWCSSTASPSAYLKVDLGQVKTVTGVATQGDPSSDKWVTKYDISYGYNGKTWISATANQLTGNNDKNTVFVNWLSVPFAAQYVRITAQAQHASVCLRVDLYGCGHFQVPYLYVKDLSDVTLPTTSSGGSVSLSCQAEFSQQRPATFTWSNSGKVLSTSTSSITVTYTGAADTSNKYHCLRINPSSREVYCNTTYFVTASLPGMNVYRTVQANVTAVLKVPYKPVVSIGIIAARSTTVTWNQPSLGSDEAPISSFKVEYSNNSFTSGPLVLSPGTTSKQLINLKPYSNYNVRVMATSVLGEGSWSVTKTLTTSTAAPEVAPLVTNLTAITSQSIHIEWQKPDVEKINGPLKQYKIIYRETGASAASKLENVAAPTTSHTLTNLKKWTNYKVQIRVNNGDYDGTSSSERTIRTMQDAPSAPRELALSEKRPTASMGPQLDITWKKPAEENGVIHWYKLKYTYVLGDKSTSHRKNLSGSTFSYSLNVLGGVKYTVTVLAETIKPGPEIRMMKQVGTYKPSIAPRGITSQKINETTYNITWQPLPREKSNGEVVAYEVKSSEVPKSRKRRTSFAPEAVLKNSTDTSTALILSDLKSCAKYKVEVRAYTTAGPGDFGVINRQIETTAPEAPTDVQKESVKETSVTLRWKEPVIHGGKVTKYTIAYEGRKDYYPEFKDRKHVDASETNKTINELYPGTKYELTVSATSHCGEGDNSTIVAIDTPVSAPETPEDHGTSAITTSETSANVTVWMAKQDNGPISHYQFIVHHVNKSTDEIPDVYKNQITYYENSIKNGMSFYITAQISAFTVNPSRTFHVGDGYNYDGYQNVPLVPNQKYKIYFRAVTTVPKYLPGNERVVALIMIKTVMEAPQIIKELSPSNILVAQDQTAVLRCSANSSGSLKYTWLKDSSPVDHSRGLIWGNVSFFWKEQVVQGSMLQVSGKSEEELGEYTCSVTSEAGTTSHTISLSRQSTICSGHSSGQTKPLKTVSLAVIICFGIVLVLSVVFNVYLWRIKRTRGAEEKYATTVIKTKSERTELPGENEVQAGRDPGNAATSSVQRGNYMELLPRRIREVPHGTQLDSSRLHYEIPQLRTGRAGKNFTTGANVSYVNVNKGLEEQEIGRSEIYEEIQTA